MNIRMLVMAGFVAHAALGAVCTMPMAHAQEMHMSDALSSESMKMVMMSPMILMSPSHSEHSEQDRHIESDPPQQTSSCDSGNCFLETSSAAPVFHGVFAISVVSPAAVPVRFSDASERIGSPVSSAPPNFPITTKTIALRL